MTTKTVLQLLRAWLNGEREFDYPVWIALNIVKAAYGEGFKP